MAKVPNGVTKQYRELCSKLENGRMKEVDLFYHITTKEMMNGGVLKGKEFEANDLKLKGVYFHVYQEENGQLTDSSPYVTERFKIPIDHLLTPNQHLFFAEHHDNHATLVLVDESKNDDLKFCYNNLVQLNMRDNPILCLRSTKPFDMSLPGVAAIPGEATEPKHFVYVNDDINLEVKIFVVGDVPLATWDVTDESKEGKSKPSTTGDQSKDKVTVQSKDKVTVQSKDKVTVTKKYSNLCSKLGENGEMKKVDVFYHVTPEEHKKAIMEEGMLKESMAQGFGAGQTNDSPIYGNLKGVYLSVGANGKLPNKSHYGTKRIKIPIDHLLTPNMHMFFAGKYNLYGTKYHATLVLVDESRKMDLQFCYNNLVELNMRDNPILCLWSTKPEGPFEMSLPGVVALPGEATEPKHLVHVNKINLEVLIFLVGDIKLATWDTVEKTKRGNMPPSALVTPPRQTSADEHLSKGINDMTLNPVSSGTPSGPKANKS